MVAHTGPAGLALFLLCCAGSLLSSSIASNGGCQQGRRIKELQDLSKKLLENYNKDELLDYVPDVLPRFNTSCQPPNMVNCSGILPYFRAIKPFLNDENIDYVIGHLNRPKCELEAEVSVPTDMFDRKKFTLAVLTGFATCMESMSPVMICEALKNKE